MATHIVIARATGPPDTPAREMRREPRRLCDGEVRLFGESGMPPGRELVARLLDVSQSGFRVAHDDDAISDGSVFRFSHQIFRGRARVVWTRACGARRESGFSLIRE